MDINVLNNNYGKFLDNTNSKKKADVRSANTKRKISVGYVLINIVFILITIACIVPVWLVISVSFSRENDVYLYGYSLIPRNFTTLAYETILSNPRILLDSYLVTICVTVSGTLVSICLISSLAYVLARKSFKYRSILSFYVFFTMLFNGGLVPYYILVGRWLGLRDTIFALIVPGLMNAWFVMLMKGFLINIPDSMIESAKIDGASEFTIYSRIVLPVSKPAIATITLFIALNYWNDWFNSMLYIDNQRLYSLQYLLMRILKNLEFLKSEVVGKFVRLDQITIPTLSARMAICILAAGPMLFIFPFFQKYFVKGLTVGAIKG